MMRFYGYGDLKSRFVGYRVAVSVNSKVKQKYFPLSRFTKEKAFELAKQKEKELFIQQLKYRQNSVFSRETNTGLVGLHFSVDLKRNSYICHRLNYQYFKNDVITHKSWGIKTHGLTEDIWFEVCRFIKNTRNADNATFTKMLNAKPTIAKVDKAFKKLELRYADVLEIKKAAA